MAKAPDPGKVSKHSRSARRATSPSIDTDKSLKRVEPPTKTRGSGIHYGAGVVKRKPKAKRLSKAQRLRQEKGVARAEAVTEQMVQKLTRSSQKAKVIQERRTTWEDINLDAGDAPRARKKPQKMGEENHEGEAMEQVETEEAPDSIEATATPEAEEETKDPATAEQTRDVNELDEVEVS